jgi:hypothetical protein
MPYIAYPDYMARTPTTFSVKKLVAMSVEMAKAIEEYRFRVRIGSESEAIRRLIDLGLEAGKGQQPAN